MILLVAGERLMGDDSEIDDSEIEVRWSESTLARRAEHERKKAKAGAGRIKGPFVRGPFPVAWFREALKSPGSDVVAVGLALWHLAGMQRSETFLVSNVFMRDV